LIRIRFALLALVGLVPVLSAPTVLAQTSARPQASTRAVAAGGIRAIQIVGNQRIEEGTIRSYMLLRTGDPFDTDRADRSLKALYATGLFQDVKLDRQGDTLVVKVQENPIVNRIAFEGNKKLTDEILRPALKLRPRGVFTAAAAQQDRQFILDAYAAKGRFAARVEPKIIRLDQNRVDVVFEINDGPATLVSRIAFVGNKHFSEGKLSEVVNSREAAWWRFLSTSDLYDPDRVNFDKELLRRFYLKNGYADFQVTDATAELAADRSAFFLTYTVNEGERYRVGKVSTNVKLRNLTDADIKDDVTIEAGDWYNGDAVERASEELDKAIRERGYTFVEVKPRITRDRAKKTVDLIFDVAEGPRIYVERIDITGNTRTYDKVIRREMRIAEGDAFNAAALRRSRQRLADLGYFEQGTGVQITPTPGSTPDKANLTVQVQEKATGEFSIGGGFSTDAGFLLDVGLKERNLVGTGITASINGVLAQRRSSISLSVTDPYFLDRNLVSGVDVFFVQTNNNEISQYLERRAGFAYKFGYQINEHLGQLWTYSLIRRDVYGVSDNASIYVKDMAGVSVLSQIGSTVTLDYRDSRINPRTGFVIRAGADFAGLGGDAHFVRTKLDGAAYVPLDRFTGNSDWGLAFQAGVGRLFNMKEQERIIDRFFLGGENLRGFAMGGAGPHTIPIEGVSPTPNSLGGRLIWTTTAELRFPVPLPADLGITGRAFVDVGGLTDTSSCTKSGCFEISDSTMPRLGAGVGVSWQTPFGLINLDLAPFVIKQKYDQTQIFRFGFGTRF